MLKFTGLQQLAKVAVALSFVLSLNNNSALAQTLVPSEAPSGSYFPSFFPFYTTSTFDPKEQGNCNRPYTDTHGYAVYTLQKYFGKKNCIEDTERMRVDCFVDVEGVTQGRAEYRYKENPVETFSNPVTDYLIVSYTGCYDDTTGEYNCSGAVYIYFQEACIDDPEVIAYLERIEDAIKNSNNKPKPTAFPTASPTPAFPTASPTQSSKKSSKSTKKSKSSKTSKNSKTSDRKK